MDDNSSTKEYDETVGKDNLPRIKLFVKTWWYRLLIGSGAFAILWVFMIFIWEKNRNNIGTELTDIALFWTHIFLGTLVFSTLITGWLQRTALIVFKIDAQQNLLIYEAYWSYMRVKHKKFKLEDIDRFDVFKRLRSRGKYGSVEWECLGLNFRTKNPMYITGPKEESNTIKYAKRLNDFLASNTNINKDRLREEITPEFSKRAKKLIKVYLISLLAIIIIPIIIVVWLLLNNPPT
ncbi:hypothetical protein ES705_07128 [subsurface metagenome]|jgi:hypothetical protein|nr:MAG: hypothetical protein CEE42_00235 [Candidatus Lokiarchaeota archaeon Loki_b31]